jgi:hypothetical protein
MERQGENINDITTSNMPYEMYWRKIIRPRDVPESLDTHKLLLKLYEKANILGFRTAYPIAAAHFEYLFVNTSKYVAAGKWLMYDPDMHTAKRNDRQIIFYMPGFETVTTLLIYVFNKIQAIMPIKDIFGYSTLNDLLRALLYSRSQRSIKKSYKFAIPADLQDSTVYRDSNVLVVQPKTWEISRKYFGVKRPSFIAGSDTTALISGSTWCTASSTSDKFREYTERYKYNLYYFVDLKDDSLWAVMTAGGSKERIIAMYWAISTSLKSKGNFDKYLKGNTGSDEGIMNFMLKNMHEYYDFEWFSESATIEARSGQNIQINPQTVYDRFNLSLDWRKQYIQYINGVDNSLFTE